MKRLSSALWPIAQTAIAASLAWYLARDVLGHHNPFFAPIAAAVCCADELQRVADLSG
ncbi:hypothetical protein [Mycobacterium sp. MFM001]|uniref:hypothetical protein n=1 Tax=Mycobacterium sp. MFM001 TaxID=2049453 RepID=UPI001EE04A3F|nr:hypothetical protein [Mycobacterium sp. MFM001]